MNLGWCRRLRVLGVLMATVAKPVKVVRTIEFSAMQRAMSLRTAGYSSRRVVYALPRKNATYAGCGEGGEGELGGVNKSGVPNGKVST